MLGRFSVIFLPLVASAHAQTPTISAARSTVVENDFSTRLSHVTGTGAKHHRVASSPLLPWPRPAELARAAAVPNQDQAELAHLLRQKESLAILAAMRRA